MTSRQWAERVKSVVDLIRQEPVWVDPAHSSRTAMLLLKGYEAGAIAVLDCGRLVGMVTVHSLLSNSDQLPVRDIMRTDIECLSRETSPREAALRMMELDCHDLPVMDGSRLLGVISSADLLPEVSRSFDPLTGLPWADSLREWAIDKLKAGLETTVLFLDVDHFGRYNKQYGHLVGDTVLKMMADTLLNLTQPETDFLCRYGGDEFTIATLRSREEADDLAEEIARAVSGLYLEGIAAEGITVTVGVHGGRRTRERHDTHYAATMDSLLGLASRNCLDRKRAARAGRGVPGAGAPGGDDNATDDPPQPTGRLKLETVNVNSTGFLQAAYVDLALNLPGQAGAHFAATSNINPTGDSMLLTAVTEATAEAVQNAFPGNCTVRIDSVRRTESAIGPAIITVTGQFSQAGVSTPIAGAAVVRSDQYRSAAAAVLSAVNRVVARHLTVKA